ncbi:hypothetical protein B0O99DRAFT_636621 [Bisporella sp. PMI_857]|nr:hypothetical protein B0O99DRAFT_636621 [Bisporella sp. PMI_857]
MISTQKITATKVVTRSRLCCISLLIMVQLRVRSTHENCVTRTKPQDFPENRLLQDTSVRLTRDATKVNLL